jgi:hypothetical protein
LPRLPNLADGLGEAKAQRRKSNAAPFLPEIAWTVAAASQPEAVRQRGLVVGKAIESLIEQATSDWQLRFVFTVGVKKLKMSLLAAHFE